MGLFARSKIILVACQPKSASTFLANTLAARAAGRTVNLVPAYGRREQVIDEKEIRKASRTRNAVVVGQHHVKNSTATQDLCNKFNITQVVLRRNLFDVCVSLRDHLRKKGPVQPIFFCDTSHIDLPDSELDMLIANFAVPWYLHFHMSWRDQDNVINVDYNDILSRPDVTIDSILDQAQLPLSSRVDRKSGTKPVKDRMNVGVAGRGAMLCNDTKDAIRRLVELYARYGSDPYLDSHLG